MGAGRCAWGEVRNTRIYIYRYTHTYIYISAGVWWRSRRHLFKPWPSVAAPCGCNRRQAAISPTTPPRFRAMPSRAGWCMQAGACPVHTPHASPPDPCAGWYVPRALRFRNDAPTRPAAPHPLCPPPHPPPHPPRPPDSCAGWCVPHAAFPDGCPARPAAQPAPGEAFADAREMLKSCPFWSTVVVRVCRVG